METQVEETKATPTTTKPEKRFFFHAIVNDKGVTHKVMAERKSDLFKKISEFPEGEIVAIIKGRELQFKETRQLTLV